MPVGFADALNKVTPQNQEGKENTLLQPKRLPSHLFSQIT